MTTVVGTLSINLMARTAQFNQAMGRTEFRLKSFGNNAGAALGTLKRFVVPAAVVAGFTRLAKANEDFTRAMTRSMAIMDDLSDKMKSSLVSTAREVARETEFTATQAAESYMFLASAGLSAEQSMTALPRVAKFAQAGMFDMATATNLLVDSQSALGMTSRNAAKNLENMTRIADVLVKANNVANGSVEDFSTALTNGAAAALRLVNKDVEEGVAVLAAFAEQGIKGQEAGTAFGIVMRDLQTKAIANKSAFREAGVAVFDANGKMRNIADIIKDLEGTLAGASDEQKKMTLATLGFSDKSVQYTQALISMSEKIRDYEDALRKAGGTTDEVAAKTQTAWEKATKKLKATVEEAAAPVVEPVKGFAAKSVDTLAEAVHGYSQVFGIVETAAEKARKAEQQSHESRMKNFEEFEKKQRQIRLDEREAERRFQDEARIDRQIERWEMMQYGADPVERAKKMFPALPLDPVELHKMFAPQESKYTPVSALQRGSNETTSAINRARVEQKTHEDKIQSLFTDEINELKKVNSKLETISDKLDEGGAVEI